MQGTTAVSMRHSTFGNTVTSVLSGPLPRLDTGSGEVFEAQGLQP